MKLLTQILGCCVALSTGVAIAQLPDAETNEVSPATSLPAVARVYLKSGKQIVAYTAASNGQLTKVSGSPFNFDISLSGANGRYLFGFLSSGQTIQSLTMSSTGALTKAKATDPTRYNEYSDCGYWDGQSLKIDHSGQELVNEEYPTQWCHTFYQSFRINSDGSLTFQDNFDYDLAIPNSFATLGNNKFAYASSCTANFGNGPAPLVKVFERMSNGEWQDANAGVAIPSAPEDTYNPNGAASGYFCPIGIATDPTNHAAILLQAFDYADGDNPNYGPIYIATYTADTNGNLKTTSTYKNMVTLPVTSNYDGSCRNCTVRMSPSGKLLAAGGSGVILFHFNGGSPMTKYKTLLAGDNIAKVLWDNTNHMYAFGSDSHGATKLWIYTVTPTSTTQVTGSPYSVTGANDIYIQNLN